MASANVSIHSQTHTHTTHTLTYTYSLTHTITYTHNHMHTHSHTHVKLIQLNPILSLSIQLNCGRLQRIPPTPILPIKCLHTVEDQKSQRKQAGFKNTLLLLQYEVYSKALSHQLFLQILQTVTYRTLLYVKENIPYSF